MSKQPATPLPWSRKDGHFHHVSTEDIDYFIHAANAYQRLVEALRKSADVLEYTKPQIDTRDMTYGLTLRTIHDVRALLAELGE